MKKIMFNDRYGLTEAVIKKRKTVRRREVTSLRLSPFLHERIRELAADYGTDMSIVMRTLLEYAINQITDQDGYERQDKGVCFGSRNRDDRP